MESTIVEQIIRYLKTVPDAFCWKEHGGMYGTAGIPDIVGCINGRFVAFEVKVSGGKTTKLQNYTIGEIQRAGGVAGVVHSVEEVKTIINGIKLFQEVTHS